MRLFLNFYLLLTFYFIQIPSIASQSTRLNHAHLIAENNQTSLYKLFVESIKTVQKGFETKLVTLFQPVHKFCKTADKFAEFLEGEELIVILYEGDENINPCSYKAHRESITMLQIFNTSIDPKYLTEVLFYSRFGKVRLGPYSQSPCPLNDTNGPTNFPPFDLKKALPSLIKIIERISEQDPDELDSELILPTAVITEEMIVRQLRAEQTLKEAKSGDTITITTMYLLIYIALLLYAMLFTVAAYPDFNIILKSQMKVDEEMTLLDEEEDEPWYKQILMEMD